MRKTDAFINRLVKELQLHLPEGWVLEDAVVHLGHVRRYTSWGYAAIYPMVKFVSPGARVRLVYGVFHTCLAPLYERISLASGSKPLEFVQFNQDTFNRPLGRGHRDAMAVNYQVENGALLIPKLLDLHGGSGIQDLTSYFARYSDLLAIRSSLEQNDHNFCCYNPADNITVIDCYLNDLDHLRSYRDVQSARSDWQWRVNMIDSTLSILGVTL